MSKKFEFAFLIFFSQKNTKMTLNQKKMNVPKHHNQGRKQGQGQVLLVQVHPVQGQAPQHQEKNQMIKVKFMD